ncbi:hypothetical protein [Jannaschia aquimarina]|uniref:Lipoprotein n=1 Tax=Jannaschia aquimarina TaxID=935700 RepID=A0A0D1EFE4_9RHOB|nr:hypothetical protein [Jannaschia aquimarina]KIT14625.1 hypothetical protein jaqu_36570 [Jannaschia aquimarina]SNS46067.1 hypothetical protein SAMN05421775_10132 [Jannaschia aquimarina]
MKRIALVAALLVAACAPTSGQRVPDGGIGGTGASPPLVCPDDGSCEE